MNTIHGIIHDLANEETIIGGCTTPSEVIIALQGLVEENNLLKRKLYKVKQTKEEIESMSKLIDASNLKNTIHDKSFNSEMMNPIFTYEEIMNMVDVSPSVHAIPLDKIKQAREKMESRIYTGEKTTRFVWQNLGVNMCLEILDEIITKNEG